MFNIFKNKTVFKGNPAVTIDMAKTLNNKVLADTFLNKTLIENKTQEVDIEISDPFVLALNVESILHDKDIVMHDIKTKTLMEELLDELINEFYLFEASSTRKYLGVDAVIKNNLKINNYLKDLICGNSSLSKELNKGVHHEDLQQFKNTIGLFN